MQALEPLIPKWSHFFHRIKIRQSIAFLAVNFRQFCGRFYIRIGSTLLLKMWVQKNIWIHDFKVKFQLKSCENRLRMFTLQLQRQKSKTLRPWEWAHWKADKICYRIQGAHDFDNFFDHIFLRTLCFMTNLKDKKISSEIVCTLYSVANFISFPMGPFPRS